MGNNHFIGEEYQGGIIFRINPDGKSGLIAAKEDQSKEDIWEKSLQIAKDCRDGGYDDWYLPSKEELNLLYQQKDIVGFIIGEFDTKFYWSSTEYNSNNAWNQLFTNGYQSISNKRFTYRMRAIRAF